MRDVVFSLSDVDLFDQDISPSDYEFFKKHTGAFRRMLEDQSRAKKKEFVTKFKLFALTNGCMKGCPSKNDTNRIYLDQAISQYNEYFVDGKASTAKNIVVDAVTLAQNRHNLQYMGANSYSKDPFFHKETRDTFRRLFGQPSERGTCLKVVCVLPLHIKFGGSICRYLRRWLEAEDCEPIKPQLSVSSADKSSTEKPPKASAKSTKKKEKPIAKSAEGIRKDELEVKEMNYRFRSLLDSHSRNYNFDDFPIFEKPLVTEQKPSGKKSETDDEALTLSEYLGVSKKKAETPASGKAVSDKAESPSSEKSVADTSDSNLSAQEKAIKEDEALKALYAKAREFLVPKKEGDDEETIDKAPLDYDLTYEEVREMFLLGKPHPNVEFEQLSNKGLSKEDAKKLNKCKEYVKETNKNGDPGEKVEKRHACANCKKVEPEPKKFKKCQRCRGKRTRFYCGRKCQVEDWIYRHNEDHNSSEEVT